MSSRIKKSITALMFLTLCATYTRPDSDSTVIVFQERVIEGKIRRPQLVLISADERPELTPILLFSGYTSKNIGLSNEILDTVPQNEVFRFSGKSIVYPKQ